MPSAGSRMRKSGFCMRYVPSCFVLGVGTALERASRLPLPARALLLTFGIDIAPPSMVYDIK